MVLCLIRLSEFPLSVTKKVGHSTSRTASTIERSVKSILYTGAHTLQGHPMIVELAVTDGPHAGKSYRFEEHATFIVGRSKNAHFSLPGKDPHLSRFHALIEVNPPLCRLQHLSETNPTLLNGAAVTQADLRDGDRVTVGQTAIVVRLLATEADAEPPTAALQAPEQRFVTLTADPNQALVFETKTYTEAYPAIPGYKIEAELGRGGMGVVYKAVRIDSGEPVALKMILPTGTVTSTALSRFIREADVVRKLAHPGIVQFCDSGVTGMMTAFSGASVGFCAFRFEVMFDMTAMWRLTCREASPSQLPPDPNNPADYIHIPCGDILHRGIGRIVG